MRNGSISLWQVEGTCWSNWCWTLLYFRLHTMTAQVLVVLIVGCLFEIVSSSCCCGSSLTSIAALDGWEWTQKPWCTWRLLLLGNIFDKSLFIIVLVLAQTSQEIIVQADFATNHKYGQKWNENAENWGTNNYCCNKEFVWWSFTVELFEYLGTSWYVQKFESLFFFFSESTGDNVESSISFDLVLMF